MKLVSVILDIKTRSLGDAFTYRVPESLGDIDVGCVVRVPFGHRQETGFVVGMHDDATEDALGFDPGKVKDVYEVLTKPFFDAVAAECIFWLAQRYLAPLRDCARLFAPPGGVPSVKKVGHAWVVEAPQVGEVDDRWVRLTDSGKDFEPRKGAVKQQAILDALQAGELRVAELQAEYGSVSAPLKSLAAKGIVEVQRRRRMRGFEPSEHGEYARIRFDTPKAPQLTAGQKDAVAAIASACDAADGRVVVVDGVTGSGKTEVYLQAIERVLAAGRTAIVLVPEISLTPQTVARFRGRFGDLVAVMHSAMSLGERFDQWDFIASGSARVVVGARSALFSPVRDVGLIVIDEEHESTYKQEDAPRYVSRDVAAWMARKHGAALVLGSATPSIEALSRVDRLDSWSIVKLPERANGRPLPRIEVVDLAREFGSGSRSMFSRDLARALHEVLASRQKAVLLLNQRGFAKFVLCRDCGHVPECPSCSLSLTYHERGNVLACHHCGYARPLPATCPECSSPYLKMLGAGTQRVEAELVDLIAGFGVQDAAIVRMDADTTRGKGAHGRLLEQFAAAETGVLLGTQMIAKGLDFDDVTLVGVINADTQLRMPDFRSAERTFDLIQQVAGRSGRADKPGRVIVQTFSAGSIPIAAAANYDRAAFLADELPKRKILGFPPYTNLADVRVWGANQREVKEEAERIHDSIAQLLAQQGVLRWTLLPATACIIERLRGNWHYHITIKAPLDQQIGPLLAPLFRARKATHGVNVAVDIDPYSLM